MNDLRPFYRIIFHIIWSKDNSEKINFRDEKLQSLSLYTVHNSTTIQSCALLVSQDIQAHVVASGSYFKNYVDQLGILLPDISMWVAHPKKFILIWLGIYGPFWINVVRWIKTNIKYFLKIQPMTIIIDTTKAKCDLTVSLINYTNV